MVILGKNCVLAALKNLGETAPNVPDTVAKIIDGTDRVPFYALEMILEYLNYFEVPLYTCLRSRY